VNQIIRSFEATIDSVLEGERAVVARINTGAVDRLRTVIDPLGCDVSHFNKTRSVLWNHGLDPIRGTVPIGEGWAKIRRSENDMIGKCRFDTDPLADMLFEKYKAGSLRGWSIKAGVHEASPPSKAEIRSNPEWEECEMVYRKWDLLEFSATGTPGNSDCVSLMVSRGLITQPEGFVPTEPPPEPAKDPERSLVPHIESDGGYWYVRGLAVESPRFTSARDAEQLLAMVSSPPPSLSSFYVSLLNQTRATNTQFQRDLEAIIDLKVRGRV